MSDHPSSEEPRRKLKLPLEAEAALQALRETGPQSEENDDAAQPPDAEAE